jgi:hypothetical protein
VEVELGEIRNHTTLRVKDDEDMDDTTKESDSKEEEDDDDDDDTITRLLIRRDSKGKLGIRFDDELVISHTNTWARSQGLCPNQKIIRCNDRVVRASISLLTSFEKKNITQQQQHRYTHTRNSSRRRLVMMYWIYISKR